MCHVFVRGDSLAAVAVSDHDYPPRVAHTMLTRCIATSILLHINIQKDFLGLRSSKNGLSVKICRLWICWHI